MPTFLVCGDPHGQFEHIVAEARRFQPAAVLLLGDMDAERPLDEELGAILGETRILWIPGNHDTETERHYDHLFGSLLAEFNLHGRVVEVAGLRIAGLGGVFRSKIWNGVGDGLFYHPEDYLKVCGKGNRWRGGLPLRHRSSLFPSELKGFDGLRADLLITHEAPDLHVHGFGPIARLAETLGVQAAFHGHHHEDIDYPNSVWRAVGMRQIFHFNSNA